MAKGQFLVRLDVRQYETKISGGRKQAVGQVNGVEHQVSVDVDLTGDERIDERTIRQAALQSAKKAWEDPTLSTSMSVLSISELN